MAKIRQGIFGPVSGKIGPIVGATWKGIPYIREAGEKRNLQRSPAQLANEARFKFANDWLVPFHPFLTIGFQNLAIGKTAIAAALSANYRQIFSGISPDIEINYNEFLVSTGPLAPLGNPQAIFTSADRLELSWEQNYHPGVAYNDQVLLVVYNEELKYADGLVGGANRAEESHSYKISTRLAGLPLHVYMGVTSLDRRQIGNSIYVGKINPL